MRQYRKIGLALCILVLVLAVVASSCTPTAEQEKIIKIGLHAAYTGPLATQLGPAGFGIMDAVRYANEQGGIDGVKVRVEWRETGATTQGAIIAHRRFKETGIVSELIFSSTQTESIVTSLQRDEMPILYFSGISEPMKTRPLRWVFTSEGGFPEMTGSFLKWVKDNWTEERSPRVGMIIYDQASGWSGLEGAKYAEELGVTWVGHEVIPLLGVIDTSTEVLRLVGEKPDWIFTGVCGAAQVVLIKDMARLGLQEKGIKLCAFSPCLEAVLTVVGIEDSKGWYQLTVNAVGGDSLSTPMSAERKTILDSARQWRGRELEKVNLPSLSMYTIGWCWAEVTMEAARIAKEKVGLENLTGRAVRDGWVNIKDFETGVFPPITITEERPYLNWQHRMCQVKNGVNYPVTDYFDLGYPTIIK